MEQLRVRVSRLLAEARSALQQPRAYQLLSYIIDLLERLNREFAIGNLDAEQLRSYGYGIYRSVIEDEIADSEIGQKLLQLSTDLFTEAKKQR